MIVNKDHPFAELYNHNYLPDREEVLGQRRRGRPKGSPNEKVVLQKLLSRKHTSHETGETRTILEWIILTLKKMVAEGDFAAIRVHEEYFGALFNPDESDNGHGIMLAPQDMEPEEWIREMEEKNAYINRIREEVMREMGVD